MLDDGGELDDTTSANRECFQCSYEAGQPSGSPRFYISASSLSFLTTRPTTGRPSPWPTSCRIAITARIARI